MVSPSKTKHSRVAANQQQQQRTANASKVKLVKGPTPLVHHRFYLDIQKHQLANKIEYTIKELGGHIEFFLSKDITHFITDKDYSHYQQSGTAQNPEGGPSNSYQNPVTPTTPLTPKTPLSTTNRHHYLQYVNEASPSSPSCGTAGTGHSSHLHQGGPGSVGAASGTTFGGSESRPAKPAAPRSRADAMLQRVRQQQQLQQSPGGSSTYNHSLLAQRNNASRPCSPLSPSPVPSPTPAASSTASVRLDRNSQSPAQLAKSWGKPIWSTEYAIKFLSKVIGSCKQENQQQQQQHGQQQQNLRFGKSSSKGSEGKTTPQHLRGDYIKIESHQRHHYRPAFALFKAWPTLNLVAKSNHSPFDSARGRDGAGAGQRSVQPSVQPATTAQATQVQEDRPSVVKTATTNQTTTNATAKQENTQQQQQQQQCGYCEICRIEYDVLANHLNADEHRAFVRNDGNFAQLDQLIADGGVDLGAFLKSVEQEQQLEEEEVTICEEPSEDCEPETRKDAIEEPGEEEECEKEEEVVKVKKRRVDKEEETLVEEEETVKKASKVVQEELEEEGRKELEERVLELRITPVAVPLKTYSRKSKEIPPSPLSTPSAAIKRTYAGRKSARTTFVAAPSPAPAATPASPAATDLEPDATVAAVDSQMFGRRSAIHHHPHNTLSHHNHQKAKAARQQQQLKEQQEKEQEQESVPEPEPIEVPEEDAVEQVVMKLHGTNESTTTTTKQNNSKMGMKQSSVVKSPSAAAAAAELALECDGLDPKNTKRISLGLRQNPKRANLNEDFTSLLDETLEPIRKPARIRRESVRRVNYSEPREDEIASQEELIESILLESTAQEAAAAAAAAAAEESCRGKKKVAGSSPKRSGSDVKIRGIRWRAPSPQSRPPVKSPLLYKVIEEPKVKSKKNNSASPTKESSGTPGSPTKASKNGLIVKIRRVRQSELSLLNDEAENFMFPKKDDSSDEETDEDRQTSSEANPGDYSQEVPSSDYDHPHNSSKRKSAGTPLPTPQPIKKRPVGRPPASAKDSTPTPPTAPATPDPSDNSTPRSRRAGVRGVAALLHDNAEYYKFPDPGSRLRFPEAPIQPGTANPETAVDDDDSEVQAALMPAPAPKRRGRKPAKTPALSTVTTPLSPEQRQQQDLLLATRGASGCSSPYQHQEQLSTCGKVIADYSKNKGTCGSSSKEDGMGAAAMFKWSTFVRNCAQIEPYRFAFERVPSLEPWYETFQRQDGASEKVYEYFGNTAYRKLPYEMGGLPPLRQNCCILNYRIKSKTPESTVPSSSNSSTCDGVTTTGATSKDQPAKPSSSSTSSSEPLSLPLKKRKLLVDSDRPRKSPREHASTLAILSLLQQQTQVNRRRTISGSSSAVPPLNLPPPSPVPSQVGYSPKKEAIKAQQQQQQEADSALGDEIRSSCGSDPVTEKDEPTTGSGGGIGAKKIKFDPPIMPEQSFVNYKVMCQQLEEFLDVADGIPEDDALPELPEAVPIVPAPSQPLKQNLLNIVQACDKEPPLSLKLVSRHESIVRKIVQYDRRPRPLSAITIKSFDGGGGGGGGQPGLGTPGGTCLGIFKKRINRTGWPNVKKRIVTRKQHQQKTSKRDSAESAGAAGEVKKEPEPPEDTSRKSSTEESQVSAETAVEEEEEPVKQEVEGEEAEEEEEDDDEDEFEDTMTMLDPEEVVAVTTSVVAAAAAAKTNGETAKKEVVGGTGKVAAAAAAATEQLLTDDEEDNVAVEEEEREEQQQQREEKDKKEMEESRQTPEPTKTEEILIPSRPCPRSSTATTLPSSKYVTKTTTTMTRIDYNVPSTCSSELSQKAPAPMEVASTTMAAEECDSISSRSIFVSDDCDTTSSTLINMCPEADPLALPCTPPVDAVENDEGSDSRPVTPTVTTVRSRQNSTRHVGGGSSPGKKRGNLQPIVCLQKINCTAATASSMRTRSSSRTPIKKTYKRSVFTSALVNSSGKPLKKKRKRKKLKLMNGGSTAGTTSPSCSEGHNSSSIADEPTNEEEEDAEEDESGTDGTDSPTVVRRGPASKNRAPTPSPVKFSPRKLRKPRGRWYRER